MHYVDLNCDLGEGIGNDEAILPFISSASIACGYHAGDLPTMEQTIQHCMHYGVAIGAHPSFPDRPNFGRKVIPYSLTTIYNWVQEQVKELQVLAAKYQTSVVHVKPHGALYNEAARNKELARAIAQAVKDMDPRLVLIGLSGSYLISEAKALGLSTASEVFADRTYQDDGRLTPRDQPGALIEEQAVSIEQVLQMVKQGTVNSLSGKAVPVQAQSICLHGDGKQAVSFAKAIQNALTHAGIIIKPVPSVV